MTAKDSQPIPAHLVTPELWAQMVRNIAALVPGPQAETLLIEARRYDACAQEIDRLNKAIQYEQHRADRIGTHSPGCWTWGPQHYECALREIERLTRGLDNALEHITGDAHIDGWPLTAGLPASDHKRSS